MNNFEHLRDFNVSQLQQWIAKYLLFQSIKNPAIDIETAVTFAYVIHRMIAETRACTELSGLNLIYIGEGNLDKAEWAATFNSLGYHARDSEWYELKHIHHYPASARAMTPEEAITRAGAIAGAMLKTPKSGGLISIAHGGKA